MPHFCALQQHLSVKASSETILPLTESCCILFPKDTIQYISIKSELLRLLICAPASPELNYLLILIASNTKNLYICTYVYMHKQVCVYAYIYIQALGVNIHTHLNILCYTHKRTCIFQNAFQKLDYMTRLIELLCFAVCPVSTQLKLYFSDQTTL